jgi:ABC-type multidrug transport system ATPase subunit
VSIIETMSLTKRYGSKLAVDGISFAVEQGQVFGFLGPNGSGKTTTIGMLLGILTPTSGQIRLFGMTGHRGLHRARQRTGATLENPNFYPYLSGVDNLRIVANVKETPRSSIDEVLELVRLTDRKRDRYQTYSLGMKQRLALAATMLGDPELVVLDEPANGLDPEGMKEIREIIADLAAAGRTIFLSSHLMLEVERMCSHVAIIRRGRIIRQASVQEIKAGTTVAELRGEAPAAIASALESYPEAVSIDVDGDTVLAELRDDDLASLNRFLAGQGIYVSRLASRQHSLEEVFMRLTGEEEPSALEGVA